MLKIFVLSLQMRLRTQPVLIYAIQQLEVSRIAVGLEVNESLHAVGIVGGRENLAQSGKCRNPAFSLGFVDVVKQRCKKRIVRWCRTTGEHKVSYYREIEARAHLILPWERHRFGSCRHLLVSVYARPVICQGPLTFPTPRYFAEPRPTPYSKAPPVCCSRSAHVCIPKEVASENYCREQKTHQNDTQDRGKGTPKEGENRAGSKAVPMESSLPSVASTQPTPPSNDMRRDPAQEAHKKLSSEFMVEVQALSRSRQ